ncbi:MAG: hypothetical protein MJ193_04920, partial [Clostridia bacterium]|nr:hypothetical protein [Clostridia bacterium]
FHFKFTLGTGSRWTTATLADGAAFIANLSCTAISYSDYTDVSTSSTVKTISLAKTSSNSFTNGNFDNINFAETQGLDEFGALKDEAGVPSNWTLNNKKYAPAGDEDVTTDSTKTYTDDDNLVAGIIKLDVDSTDATRYMHSALTDTLFGSATASDFDTLYDVATGDYFDNYERIGAPNLLAIAGLNGNKYFRSFKSDSISLTAGTNYKLSVYAKTIGAATYSIYLTGATGATTYFGEQNNFVVSSTATGEWTKYTFYIEVGLNSASVNLVLALGYDTDISGDLDLDSDSDIKTGYTSSGIVLFDCVTLSSDLTDEEFDAIQSQSTDNTYRKISFLTNGFDVDEGKTYTDNKPISPSGYTGAAGKEQSADNTSAGIALRDSSSSTYAIDADDAVSEYF